MKTWLLSAVAALALGGAAQAQDAPANTIDTASAMNACVAALVPAGAACHVVGTGSLGQAGGQPVSWALYELITGEDRSGLSVLLASDPADPANLRVVDQQAVPTESLDRWKHDPYVVASIMKRDDAEYAVMMVPGDEKPSAFSVHRLDPGGWTALDTSGMWADINQRLAAVTGPQCYPITTDMSWRAFSLRYGMSSDNGNCGTAVLSLGIDDGAVKITDAMAVREDLTPAPRSHRRHW